MTPIVIRPANSDDHDFILSLIPRLAEFGPPSWRDPASMTAIDTDVVRGKFRDSPEGTAMFMAEEDGVSLGYIHVESSTDYYEKTEYGHVADLVVAPAGEGRGIGGLLLAAGESWARERGYTRMTLTVFAQNSRAREVYEHVGYGEDMVKYVKPLD